jgi:hypothetical protein
MTTTTIINHHFFSNNNKWTRLEAAFHEYVAPKFTGLDYNPNLEVKNFQSRINMDERMTIYSDSRTKIVAHKRQTWCLDDYDVFIKVEFFVDGNLICEIKDY